MNYSGQMSRGAGLQEQVEYWNNNNWNFLNVPREGKVLMKLLDLAAVSCS